MSIIHLKTTYERESFGGETKEMTLFAQYGNTSEYVTFYDEFGNEILCVNKDIYKNILHAMTQVTDACHDVYNLPKGIERQTDEEEEFLKQIIDKRK